MMRTVPTRCRLPLGLLALSLVVVLMSVSATAQPQQAEPTTPEGLLADRWALLAERIAAQPGPVHADQLRRAAILLDRALELEAADAELWRSRAVLHQQLDEPEAMREALQQYSELRPEDEAAQLELLLYEVHQGQTVDQRLERIDALLEGEQDQAMGDRVRSRLASYGASMAREMGDQQRFGQYLVQAVRLDALNPDVGRLTYELGVQRGVEPGPLGQAAARYVRAAPSDPRARLALGSVLLELGLYERAAAQYETAAGLSQRPLGMERMTDWVVALLGDGQDRAALWLLNQLGSTPGAQQDEPAFALPVELELLYVALRVDQDQREQAAAGFERMRDLLLDEAMPERMQARGALQLAWIAAVFDLRDGQQVQQWLEQARAAEPALEDLELYAARVEGWQALHAGDDEAANAQLSEHAQRDPLAALGLALLEDDEPARAALLQQVYRADPEVLAGILAARRLRAMGHAGEPVEAAGLVSGEMARDTRQLWEPDWNASPWVVVGLSVSPREADYLEPLVARVQIRNRTQMTLPLDDQRGIPTTLMVRLVGSAANERLPRPTPFTLDAGRALVLEPGAELEIPVRLNRTELALLIDQHLIRTLRYELAAILGPVRHPRGFWTADPLGAVGRSHHQMVRGEPLTEQRLEVLLGQLDDGEQPVERMRAAARLLRTVMRLPEAVNGQPMRQRIVEALVEAYEQMDAGERAWVVAHLPGGEQGRAAFEPVHRSVAEDAAPAVVLMYLAQHVADGQDPVLEAGLEHADEAVRGYARALGEALERAEAANGAEELAEPQDFGLPEIVDEP